MNVPVMSYEYGKGSITIQNAGIITDAAKWIHEVMIPREEAYAAIVSVLDGCLRIARSNQYNLYGDHTHPLGMKLQGRSEGVFGSSEGISMDMYFNLQKIESMTALQNNWNGNGGLPFPKKDIAFFKKVIHNLKTQPKLYPTGRVSLFLEYELSDRSYLGIELFLGRVTIVKIPQRIYSEATTFSFNSNIIEHINKEVDHFYEIAKESDQGY